MAISVESYVTHNYPSFEKLPRLIRKGIISFFKNYYYEDEINAFLEKNVQKDAFSFIESILEYFNIDININKNQLSRIPTYGRCVIIANHPLGALDALALLHVVQDVRKDVKIVASGFLSEFNNVKDLIIPIDNVKGKMSKESVNAIYNSLEKEQVVILFPSGEVSRARPNGIKDTKWRSGFLKIAEKTHSPILPIFINAKNSKNFYLVSMINKSLATASIPHEMFKYRDKNIGFKIGKSIPFESYFIPSLDIVSKVKLFRKHFYLIARNASGIFKTYNAISLPENRQELKRALESSPQIGQTSDGKKIFLYRNDEENVVLREIGRLREISFRQVKEGSGKKRDIDEYDYYYEHIVLWDDKDLEIVGSYRIAKAREVIDMLDVKGLYTASLFEYSENFVKYFDSGIELGRSFVQPKYWNSRALDYLWQGIGAYLKTNPDIRYMFGPVSISRAYSNEAVEFLVYFYMNYFGAEKQAVSHIESYKISDKSQEKFEELFVKNDYNTDLNILKTELQLLGYAIPTLYKQYSDLCLDNGVQFMDFGIDKDFDNCVDGFILVDTDKLKPLKRKRYLSE